MRKCLFAFICPAAILALFAASSIAQRTWPVSNGTQHSITIEVACTCETPAERNIVLSSVLEPDAHTQIPVPNNCGEITMETVSISPYGGETIQIDTAGATGGVLISDDFVMIDRRRFPY